MLIANPLIHPLANQPFLTLVFDDYRQWLRSCLLVWQRDPFFTDPPVTC